MTRDQLHVCPCGASVIWGSLATEEEMAAWEASHAGCKTVWLAAYFTARGFVALGTDEAVLPVLRGRNVVIAYFGPMPTVEDGDALEAELRAAGATVRATRPAPTIWNIPTEIAEEIR